MQSDGEYTVENYDGYSLAEGGFFSKKRRDERKEKRAEKRAARKGAKPLKVIIQNGVKKFKQILSPVTKNPDGTGTRADGTIVPAARMGTINAPKGLNVPALNFDKTEALNKTVEVIEEAGKPAMAVTVPENDTVTAVDSNGVAGVYKKTDTVVTLTAPGEGAAGDVKTPMSATSKWLIGGGVALALVIGIAIYKKRNN